MSVRSLPLFVADILSDTQNSILQNYDRNTIELIITRTHLEMKE
jgi:hypothetical protein